MAGRFVLRRSAAAREQAQCHVEVSVEKMATFVALVTRLADRMEGMPSGGIDRDRERRGRVAVLRRAAAAGQRQLAERQELSRRDVQDGQRGAAG